MISGGRSRFAALVLGIAGLTGCKDAVGPSGGITVSGVVVDENLNPRPRVGVLITGHRQVFTDETGRFSVSGVETPYELATWFHHERAALVYTRLTRADPLVVQPAGPFSELPYTATLTGWVSAGSGYTQSPNSGTAVSFESPELTWSATVDGGQYTAYPRWNRRQTTTGTVHALQWQSDPTTGARLRYGYGERTGVVLAHGASVRDVDVPLTSVANGSISGSMTVPDGYVVSARRLHAGFEATPRWTQTLQVQRDATITPTFDYVVPVLPGSRFGLWAQARSGPAVVEVFETGITSNAAGVVLDFMPAPNLIEPAAGANNVHHATRFSWSRFGNSIYLLSIRYNSSDVIIPHPPNFYVLTTDTTAVLPDLSQFGLNYYRNTPYVWEVFAWEPIHRVDDTAVETWFVPQGDVRHARSVPRDFRIIR